MPATASGIRMKPPWLMLEYASIRTMFVWRSASTLPTVIDSAASTHMNGWYTSCACGKATKISVTSATKPGRLGPDAQERGDRRRRTLVRVGRPRVERHGADLEREADDDEHDAERLDAAELPVRRDRWRRAR